MNHNQTSTYYQFQIQYQERISPQNGKYCLYCGDILTLDANFCPSCGSKITFTFFT